MSKLKVFRKWMSNAVAKIMQTSQPKPAYKIYEEIVMKSSKEKRKQPMD